jgi:hypothetical protein
MALLGPGGLRLELAQGVQVVATGTTAEFELSDLAPGDYYVDVRSACAWQIELTPKQ